MPVLTLHKLPSRDGVVCKDCLRRDFASQAHLAVSLHPEQFPGAYRMMACTICQSACACSDAICGSQLCRSLRMGVSRPGETWPHGLTARAATPQGRPIILNDDGARATPALPGSRWR